VDLRRARLLSETDHGHLGAATLDRPLEARVRLDAIHRQDAIGRSRVLVQIDGHARRGSCHLDRGHGGADLGTHGLFGHAEGFQHLHLPIGGPATVTSHGRNHERIGTEVS